MRLLYFASIVVVCCAISVADAQDLPSSTRPISGVKGSVGTSIQAYGTGLEQNRRAPFEARLFANSSFLLFGMRSGFRLSYSTDDNSLRQSMNRFALRSTYGWRNFTVGDASPNFSRYSVRGATVRGGMIEIEPGKWSATIVAGRSKRAVDPSNNVVDSRGASFRQMLYAFKVGYEANRSSFARLIGVFGKDVGSSLDDSGDLRPAENANITPQAGISLLDGRLDVKGEVTASAYSPDTGTEETDDGPNIPFVLSPFVTSRARTSVKYASELSAAWNDEFWGVLGSFQRVDRGFQSLGIEQTRSDEQVVRIRPRLKLADGKVNLSSQYSNSRDNLDGALNVSRQRSQFGLQSTSRFDSGFTLAASYLRFWATTDYDGADTLAVVRPEPVSNSFTISPAYTMQRGDVVHTTSITSTYQRFSDGSEAPSSRLDSKNWSGAANYVVALPSTQTWSAGINWVSSSSESADVSAYNLTTGAGRSFFEQSLLLDIALGVARSTTKISYLDAIEELGSTQYSLNFSGRYKLGSGDSIRMNVQGLSNQVDNAGASFEEVRALVRYEHRF